ncbi:hypothetical protein GCM10011385_40890 [Nitratireductor aestuarii]|uniref:DUF1236 domain-containing protein n=1 Tax=Nitratireductor aestuarii TaxID=1735103 RepID=A0A916S3G0_9HYPH|nr:DUF1236 domain-containing protein [Nitratireductor aestuarii]GGA82505.1 hypothetical protein GCM10011385_40890 [Nitratireductor aestuarii]
MKGMIVKRQTLAFATLAAMIATTLHAQTVVIEPAQEITIREYVTAHPIEPIELKDVEVSVGAVLPETVELHRIEAQDLPYSYVVVDDRTLVVEPETRKVIHIIQ